MIPKQDFLLNKFTTNKKGYDEGMRNFCANQLKIMSKFMTKLRVASSLIVIYINR